MADEDISDMLDGLSEADDITIDESQADESTTTEAESSETDSSDAEETTEQAEEADDSLASDDDATEAEADSEAEEQDPKEIARQAYLAREEARKQRDEANQQNQQEFLDDAVDEQDRALRELQIEAYNNKVERNTDKLATSYERAVASIDLFRTGTPEQKEELAIALDEFGAQHVRMDNNGNPIQITGDLYQFLQNKAVRIERLAQVGARSEKQAGARQSAATTPAPSASPNEKLSKEDKEAAALASALDNVR